MTRTVSRRSQIREPELEAIYFTQDTILSYIRKRPWVINDKKFHELLVGWILTQFLGDQQKKSMYVGFSAKPGYEIYQAISPLTIDSLLEWPDKHIEDESIDICIGNGDIYTKYQVTRFYHLPDKQPHRRLAELIRDKCLKYASDPKLYLAVCVENSPSVTEEELVNLCAKTKVPFGGIILVMKAFRMRGHFSLAQVYPKPVIGKSVITPLLV